MNLKMTWQKGAQWLVVLLCALTLKLYYAQASAEQLRWILAPVTRLVELVSGTSFAFESGAGYLSQDRSFLIAPACAGVNFMIAAFLMLAARRLLRGGAKENAWSCIPASAIVAYLTTLLANTVRIAVALRLRQLPESGWLNRGELHRVEGIMVYCGFLLLLFLASEAIGARKTPNLLRRSLFPLLVYYATTLGVPLLNGGYRQGAAFWEHSAFVLLIPALLILPLAAFSRLTNRISPRRRTETHP